MVVLVRPVPLELPVPQVQVELPVVQVPQVQVASVDLLGQVVLLDLQVQVV